MLARGRGGSRVGEKLPSALIMSVSFMAKGLGGHRKVLEGVLNPLVETVTVLYQI